MMANTAQAATITGTQVENDEYVITVDGTLSNGSIEPVQASCMEALSKGKQVRLHLRDVSAIDEGGRKMLQELAGRGIDLKANGLYSAYIVDEIQSAGRKGTAQLPVACGTPGNRARRLGETPQRE